jgi:hypothetical protein
MTAIIDIGSNATIKKIKVTFIYYGFTDCTGNMAWLELRSLDYFLANNVAYINDSVSQGIYGVIGGTYENANIQDTLNLVKTPALDGTYTGGLCQDWTAIGAGTFTENTNPVYIRNGTKSQKVFNAGYSFSSFGISQIINIRPNVSYSFYALIYIDPGNPGPVTIRLSSSSGDPITYATTGSGWIEILIENFSYATPDLLCEIYTQYFAQVSARIFFIDSVQIAEGPEVSPFVVGDAADILYAEANNYLQFHKDPAVEYDLNLFDLYESDPSKFSEEQFNIGDTIRVVDSELAIDSNLLVVKKQFQPRNPAVCSVKLENNKQSLQSSIVKTILHTALRKRKI